MPGARNIVMGGGVALIGLLITMATYATSPGGYYVVAYGAVLAGGLQFCVGLGQWVIYVLKKPHERTQHHLRIELRVILRSMLAMAARDGTLRDDEVSIIELISRSLLGEPLARDMIESVFDDMKRDEGRSHIEEIEAIQSQLSREGAALALTAAVMVALADGDFEKREREEIWRLAGALNISQEQVEKYVTQARVELTNLAAQTAAQTKAVEA